MRSRTIPQTSVSIRSLVFTRTAQVFVICALMLAVVFSGSDWQRLAASEQTETQWATSSRTVSEQPSSTTRSASRNVGTKTQQRLRSHVRSITQAAFTPENNSDASVDSDVLKPQTVAPSKSSVSLSDRSDVSEQIIPLQEAEHTTLRAVEDSDVSVLNSVEVHSLTPVADAKAFIDLSGPTDSRAGMTTSASSAASTMDQVRLGAWLLIVLCGMVLAVLAIRRWRRNQSLPVRPGRTSRIVETLSLGPGRSVSLIEISGMRALVGADAGGIRTIVMAPRSFDDEILDHDTEDSLPRDTHFERTAAMQH